MRRVRRGTPEVVDLGRVLVVEPLGSHKLLTMKVGSEMAKVSVAPDARVAPDQDVWIHFDPEKIRWMDAATGEAIMGANA